MGAEDGQSQNQVIRSIKKEMNTKEKNVEIWKYMPEHPQLTNLKKNYGDIPKEAYPALEDFAEPHIKSFDWFTDKGIFHAIDDIPLVSFQLPNGDKVNLKITNASFERPTYPKNAESVIDLQDVPEKTPGRRGFASKNVGQRVVGKTKVYPTECRQRYTSYKGQFGIEMSWWIDGVKQQPIQKILGNLPIMLRSKMCNLSGLSPTKLVERGEHDTEFGGYFISKGHEKLIRMLLMTRANFPHFLRRSKWLSNGKNFTDKGVIMRCVRKDRSYVNNTLHFLSDGSVKLMFNVGRELFFVPIVLILKALVNVTDEFIYKQVIVGFEDNLVIKGYIADMLRTLHKEGVHSHHEAQIFLGTRFRLKIEKLIGEWNTDSVCCEHLLDRGVAVHCQKPMEKFNILVYALQKLYAGVEERCIPENPDHVMLQEVLLGGHLYLSLLKDKLLNWLQAVQYSAVRKATNDRLQTLTHDQMSSIVASTFQIDRNFDSFIATGTVPLKTGQGLPQTTGLTIMVENLNRNRYLAHFRSVHRGAFFQELRTTDARQLQPDAWGFICPVHTPDGSPCGLLNHLSAFCKVVTQPQNSSGIPAELIELGMLPVEQQQQQSYSPYALADCYKVILDGVVLGYIPVDQAPKIVDILRSLKVKGDKVPQMTEIVLIPKKEKGQFPGLFLFTSLARMMRPVLNIKENLPEYIGTMEQLYLDICIIPEEAYEGRTTHREINERTFLSHLAALIPMPDCNQSPRNMYQCQMGKQTMGTPYLTYHRFSENKLYRLYNPGAPLFRPAHHDYLHLDDYPSGTNAIVAVISYTGYDMEDSMIICKSSFERGFGHGCVYKSEHIDLRVELKNPQTQSVFTLDPHTEKPLVLEKLGPDGLPYIGVGLEKGDPYYCFLNAEEGRYVVKYYSGVEKGYVDSVKLKGDDLGNLIKCSVVITIRTPKNPRPGDKFASRAGQKGICSFLWPSEDMPFTESGLVPDILFNPHGFPSRMTIAMMIEMMAGKSGAIHGLVHDASPFKFSEEDSAIKYMGDLLEKGGYNYYGTERMYSGVDGREMTADIFFGIVYYQRLRHMVSEKWQVRATGATEPVKRQPIKGRRRGGGVRFGEMEKDCLISHGASRLLQDRLFFGSDGDYTDICTKCGSILSPQIKIPKLKPNHYLLEPPLPECSICGTSDFVESMPMPYVFKYLTEQLASVNIKLRIDAASPYK